MPFHMHYSVVTTYEYRIPSEGTFRPSLAGWLTKVGLRCLLRVPP